MPRVHPSLLAVPALTLAALVACAEASPQAPSSTPGAEAKATAPPPPAAPVGIVGQPAPDFTLPDLDGNPVSLATFKGRIVVLEWFNPECPFVKKAHGVGSLVDTAKRHTDGGVVWLAINSGAPGKQGHDPAVNKSAATTWNLSHPILRDESGEVGKRYGATNTPHLFVIDAEGKVAYAGAVDNSPDGERASPAGGTLVSYVDQALAELKDGKPVSVPSTKAYGCSVKYGS